MTAWINELGAAWLDYAILALLQNTLWLGLVLAALAWLKEAPAAWKHTIALVGLIKLVLPPLLRLPVTAPVSGEAGRAGYWFARLDLLPSSTGTPSAAAASGGQPEMGGLLLVLWAGLALVHLIFPFIAILRLALRLGRARPVAASQMPAGAVAGPVTVFRTEGIPVPLTLGLFPGKVFVPAAWDDWSCERQRLVLRHEVAHLRRHDGLVKLLQVVVRALYFFHPLVLILDRRLDEYREMACDDASVAGSEGSALVYARHLVEIAESAARDPIACEPASTLIKRRNELLRRIHYQLKEGTMRSVSKGRTILVLIALTVLILPLSWYSGDAAPDGPKPKPTAEATAKQGAVKVKYDAESGKKVVTIKLQGDDGVFINEEKAGYQKLNAVLAKIASSDPQDVIMKLVCGKGVKMGTIFKVQQMLGEHDLRQVSFVNHAGKDLALLLPPPNALKKLAGLPQEDVLVLKVAGDGTTLLGGKKLKPGKLQAVLAKKQARNPNLVLVILTEEATPYDDFTHALEMAKLADAQRIVINPPGYDG